MQHDDDGTLGPLGRVKMKDNHHSNQGDKGAVDATAQTVPSCFLGDSRPSVVELCTLTLVP